MLNLLREIDGDLLFDIGQLPSEQLGLFLFYDTPKCVCVCVTAVLQFRKQANKKEQCKLFPESV